MSLEFPAIDPVAFSLGPLDIRWYALAYLAGFLLGWRYILYLAGKEQAAEHVPAVPVNKNDIDDLLAWVIVGVILGGRLGYALFYQFGLYSEAPLEIFKIWQGGMSFHGGALGAIVAMALFARLRRLPFLKITDYVACAVPIGLFFGRIANFINGELFGRVTDKPWGIIFPHGGPMPRHPSQLYEAALEGAVLFVLLAVLAHRRAIYERAGILSGVFLAGYGCARFIVEFFRAPDAHIGYVMDVFTMGQILCVPMVLAGIGIIIYSLRHKTVTIS